MQYPPVVEELAFAGWQGLRLSNGLVDAICVPELGGRLMQFSLGGYDYLFINPELLGKRFSYAEHAGDGTLIHWKNYGGAKTWPAPQGWDNDEQWPGPPDPVLDSGRYAFEIHQGATVAALSMTSPPDARTGLRIRRELSLAPNSSRLQLKLSFENISRRTVRWSIWDVAQLACSASGGGLNDDCWLYIPIDAEGERPYAVMFGEDNAQYQLDARRGLLAVQYQGIVGKIGLHSPAGWLAFANRQTGFALCMQFPYQPAAAYPDNGATVECWTESPGAPSPIPIRSPGYLLEAEVLSPLFTLQPGEVAEQKIVWSAAYSPAPIIGVTDVGCVRQALTAEVNGDWLRLQGCFGCFLPGQAELECLDAAGERLSRLDLGPVSPLRTLRLDMSLRRPAAARLIRLNILDSTRAYAGTLARLELPKDC